MEFPLVEKEKPPEGGLVWLHLRMLSLVHLEQGDIPHEHTQEHPQMQP